MEPYDDPECKCHALEDEIQEKYPDADWNGDEACAEWNLRYRDELVDNDIEFKLLSDEYYGCTCPTCGRMVCSWCAG